MASPKSFSLRIAFPSGPFSKIIESSDSAHEAPLTHDGEDVPREDRFVTYVHRVRHIRADDVATTVLAKLASHDASIIPYGNVLIVTAGTTDLKVARECAATLAVLGVRADVLADVGVAGLGRLLLSRRLRRRGGARRRWPSVEKT